MMEHRLSERRRMRLPVMLFCPRTRQRIRASSRDISLCGMFVETAQAPPLGCALEVWVSGADYRTRVNAHVVRQGAGGVGLMFEAFSLPARQALEHCLQVA